MPLSQATITVLQCSSILYYSDYSYYYCCYCHCHFSSVTIVVLDIAITTKNISIIAMLTGLRNASVQGMVQCCQGCNNCCWSWLLAMAQLGSEICKIPNGSFMSVSLSFRYPDYLSRSDRKNKAQESLSLSLSLYIYIYKYIHICMLTPPQQRPRKPRQKMLPREMLRSNRPGSHILRGRHCTLNPKPQTRNPKP